MIAQPGPCNIEVRDATLTQKEFLHRYHCEIIIFVEDGVWRWTVRFCISEWTKSNFLFVSLWRYGSTEPVVLRKVSDNTVRTASQNFQHFRSLTCASNLRLIFRPSATKSGLPYGVMSVSSTLSCRTPLLSLASPQGGLALHCHVTVGGTLGLYAESTYTCLSFYRNSGNCAERNSCWKITATKLYASALPIPIHTTKVQHLVLFLSCSWLWRFAFLW